MAALRPLLFSSKSVSGLRMKLGLNTSASLRNFSNKWVYTMNSTCPVPEFDGRKIFEDHNDLYKFSIDYPEKFWSKLGVNRLEWYKEFDQVTDCDLKQGKIKWFIGGKLNVAGKSLFVFVCFSFFIMEGGRYHWWRFYNCYLLVYIIFYVGGLFFNMTTWLGL